MFGQPARMLEENAFDTVPLHELKKAYYRQSANHIDVPEVTNRQ